ncbi:MAG: 6-carboxytetrahydropterin synthase [Pseudomonadota bacterium]
MAKMRIRNPRMNFNAGHFTIFSATDREDLHGHSFFIGGEFDGPIDSNGLAFDYKVVKEILAELCDSLDEKMLLPEQSPHLTLGEKDGYVTALYDGETMMFLPRDVKTLPVRNVTLEELARYFCKAVCDSSKVQALPVDVVTIEVFTAQGQCAGCTWSRENGYDD